MWRKGEYGKRSAGCVFLYLVRKLSHSRRVRRGLEQRLLAPSAPVTSPRGLALRAFGPMVVASVVSACTPEPRSNRLELTPCRVGDQHVSAMCGDLSVPENAAEPAGVRIPVHVAVLPASAAGSKLTPLLLLMGGPGQAATRSGVP